MFSLFVSLTQADGLIPKCNLLREKLGRLYNVYFWMNRITTYAGNAPNKMIIVKILIRISNSVLSL